jgi:hypothetical protein
VSVGIVFPGGNVVALLSPPTMPVGDPGIGVIPTALWLWQPVVASVNASAHASG